MPTDPQIHIAIDPAVSHGPMAIATRNPDGTVNVQVATVGDDGTAHVDPPETRRDIIGHVIGDLTQFASLGWTGEDGLTFPGAEDPPPTFASGGLISTRVRPGEVHLATSGCVSEAALALYTGQQPWLSMDEVHAQVARVSDEVERRARLNRYVGRVERAGRAHGRRNQTVPDDSGRSTPAPEGDVLDRIDAAVDELCACGCRAKVPADGASAYFATAVCQRRWHGRQATDPQEVYNRGDAADVYVGADDVAVPLREHPTPTPGSVVDDLIRRGARGTIQTGRPAREENPHEQHVHIHMTPPRAAPPPCPDPYGVAYRRACPQCGQQVIPRPVVADPAEWDWSDRFFNQDLRLECPTCDVELPGPTFVADVAEDGNRMLLILRGGEATTKRLVYVNRLNAIPRNAPGRDDYIEYLWRTMERELEAFRLRWLGRAAPVRAETRIGMAVIAPRSTLITDGMS